MKFTCYICFIEQDTAVECDLVKCGSCSSVMRIPQTISFVCTDCKSFMLLKENASSYQCGHCFGVFRLEDLCSAQKFKFEAYNEKYGLNAYENWDDYIYHDAYAKRIANSHVSVHRKNSSIKKEKPVNSYMIYCMEQRVLLKEMYPTKPFKEIGAMLGKAWRGLTKDEKHAYFLKKRRNIKI